MRAERETTDRTPLTRHLSMCRGGHETDSVRQVPLRRGLPRLRAERLNGMSPEFSLLPRVRRPRFSGAAPDARTDRSRDPRPVRELDHPAPAHGSPAPTLRH